MIDLKIRVTALSKLQNIYNLLIVTNPVNQLSRVFIIHTWTPMMGQINFCTLVGREITDHLDDNSLPTMIQAGGSSVEITPVMRQTIETKLEILPVLKYQFSSQFLWEIFEKSF
ncbi:MAG: hypothetical protein EOM67_14135 [Spirochaetia bacterium]|nr:hypothetical protein [Spirochaetia bacterium]